MDDFTLLTALSIALFAALTGGVIARAVRLPAIVGYLAAGLVISPFTPGYVANGDVIRQLAELGVIFLMFGIGLHIRLADLIRVRGVAVPAALGRMAAITGLVFVGGVSFGMEQREALALGLAVSIASTVVAIRTLDERGQEGSTAGRVVVGWLVVEDLATVLILTMLPALAPDASGVLSSTAIGLLKAAIFVGTMLTVGGQLVRWMLGRIAQLGSRELFVLAAVGSALGIATGAATFGVSIALGAFIAGVAISETETSHQAAADVLPFRDAFAVLFFVSTGMLLDPAAVIREWPALIAILAAVVLGKALLAIVLARLLRQEVRTTATLATSLSQVGEFSFIIAQQATVVGAMGSDTYNLVLAAAVLSIALTPLFMAATPRVERVLRRLLGDGGETAVGPEARPAEGHVVVAGYGRVGRLSAHAAAQLGHRFVVVDADYALTRTLRLARVPAVWGDVASANVLVRAGIVHARVLLLAVPDAGTALLAAANARRLNKDIVVLVRATAAETAQALRDHGANRVVVPEYEGGIELMRELLLVLGLDDDASSLFAQRMRDHYYAKGPPVDPRQPLPDT